MRVAAAVTSIAIVLVAGSATGAGAQDSEKDPGAASAGFGGVGAVLDRAVEEQMELHGIPGAVAVVVDGGEVVLARGYGYADREQQVPVDTGTTRFDIGSVTKLFTATAVMQQVEQATLDLDADVNAYLSDVQVPATFAEPVTLAHLLTHTAGFDERHWVGWFTLDLDAVEPLGENLARHLPPRIRPPGQLHQYNNHGFGLAGHAVETVSGLAFDAYVTERILEPLGMERTTFGTPPELEAVDAVGYQPLGPNVEPIEPWYLHLRPAGGLWSTADDMAAFLLAHLGHAGHDVVLSVASIERMQQEQFASHPAVPGIGYGFFQGDARGRHAVQHGGGWVGFGSGLYLVPEEDLGIFVAFNHGSGPLAVGPVVDAVLTERLGPPDPGAAADAPVVDAPERFAGTYRWIRHDRHTFMRLVSLLGAPVLEVEADAEGYLVTRMSPGFVPDGRWAPTGQDGVFAEIGGERTIAFDFDGDRARRVHVAGLQLFPMERIGWHQTPQANGLLLGVLLAGLLTAAVGWPVGWLRSRRRRRNGKERRPALPRRLAGTIGVLGVAFFGSLVVHFAAAPGVMLEPGVVTRALLVLPILLAVLAVWLGVVVLRAWARRAGTGFSRLHHTVLALLFLVLIPALYHWRLLGFHW